jgi:hypothetical protein
MSFFLSEIHATDVPARVKVQVLRKGQWKHEDAPGGTLVIDDTTLETIEKAFREGIRGKELPVNLSHRQSDFVVGWVRDLERSDGALYAVVDVVDRDAAEAVKQQKLRYSSAELLFNYTDPETQQVYPAVLKGLALTNYPFLKRLEPAQVLNLSEIEEVQLMDERLREMEQQLVQLQEKWQGATQQLLSLQEENAKLKQANELLLAEMRKQQDEMLLKQYEHALPPAVRKVVAAMLAMGRGSEVHLSELREGAEQRPAELHEMVELLLAELATVLKPKAEPLERAQPRTVGDDAERLLQLAQQVAKENGLASFGQAVKVAARRRE